MNDSAHVQQDSCGAALASCLRLAASTFVLLLFAHGTWAFCLLAAGFAFAYGGWLPLFPTIVADIFGVGSLGVIYGITNAGSAIGGALGPFLSAYVFDVTQSYSFAFILAETVML